MCCSHVIRAHFFERPTKTIGRQIIIITLHLGLVREISHYSHDDPYLFSLSPIFFFHFARSVAEKSVTAAAAAAGCRVAVVCLTTRRHIIISSIQSRVCYYYKYSRCWRFSNKILLSTDAELGCWRLTGNIVFINII